MAEHSVSRGPVLLFDTRRAWERWLAKGRAESRGVWLRIARKDAGVANISYADALEVALCYGWIDGQKSGGDALYWRQWFGPRRACSKWSRINRGKALALIEKGAMKPSGLAEVERAKADGRWKRAYEAPSRAQVPGDLKRALAGNKSARKFFETLDSRNRYAIVHRVHDTKKPETRARRIGTFVAMLAAGKKLYP